MRSRGRGGKGGRGKGCRCSWRRCAEGARGIAEGGGAEWDRWVGWDGWGIGGFDNFDLGVVVVIFRFDRIVEVGGIGGFENGDCAAAFFGGGVGGVHRFDEFFERVESGLGEGVGVGGHVGGSGVVRAQGAGKRGRGEEGKRGGKK